MYTHTLPRLRRRPRPLQGNPAMYSCGVRSCPEDFRGTALKNI